uniref:histidine kinase n=1 Tax=Chromera velia CCMP2878 TaxID=1169474 RepID=A0A0G4HW37_9ALVE|eukprot:Cvel_8970.t1-p1 / transcript=Cvel_8970.t1 / gene=Cvel_8970 / organism=Chromera_velia_CCMP2878 / gene_product=hypothetical protein / transcript_product=hypothetical protein / location=Cvel_scaffold506:15713-31798(-) / protein_length=2329 / sequence_SO=supercontig / SO=protein_coding / is_pseudo=false
MDGRGERGISITSRRRRGDAVAKSFSSSLLSRLRGCRLLSVSLSFLCWVISVQPGEGIGAEERGSHAPAFSFLSRASLSFSPRRLLSPSENPTRRKRTQKSPVVLAAGDPISVPLSGKAVLDQFLKVEEEGDDLEETGEKSLEETESREDEEPEAENPSQSPEDFVGRSVRITYGRYKGCYGIIKDWRVREGGSVTYHVKRNCKIGTEDFHGKKRYFVPHELYSGHEKMWWYAPSQLETLVLAPLPPPEKNSIWKSKKKDNQSVSLEDRLLRGQALTSEWEGEGPPERDKPKKPMMVQDKLQEVVKEAEAEEDDDFDPLGLLGGQQGQDTEGEEGDGEEEGEEDEEEEEEEEMIEEEIQDDGSDADEEEAAADEDEQEIAMIEDEKEPTMDDYRDLLDYSDEEEGGEEEEEEQEERKGGLEKSAATKGNGRESEGPQQEKEERAETGTERGDMDSEEAPEPLYIDAAIPLPNKAPPFSFETEEIQSDSSQTEGEEEDEKTRQARAYKRLPLASEIFKPSTNPRAESARAMVVRAMRDIQSPKEVLNLFFANDQFADFGIGSQALRRLTKLCTVDRNLLRDGIPKRQVLKRNAKARAELWTDSKRAEALLERCVEWLRKERAGMRGGGRKSFLFDLGDTPRNLLKLGLLTTVSDEEPRRLTEAERPSERAKELAKELMEEIVSSATDRLQRPNSLRGDELEPYPLSVCAYAFAKVGILPSSNGHKDASAFWIALSEVATSILGEFAALVEEDGNEITEAHPYLQKAKGGGKRSRQGLGMAGPKAQDLSNLAWALATAQLDADHPLWDALAPLCAYRAPEMTPQGLANSAWAFAKVGSDHPVMFRKISQVCLSQGMKDFTPPDLAQLSWAFSRFGFNDAHLFEKICDQTALKAARFDPKGVSTSLLAFASLNNLDFLTRVPARVLCAQTAPRLCEYTGEQLARLLSAGLSLGAFESAGMDGWGREVRKHQEERRRLGSGERGQLVEDAASGAEILNLDGPQMFRSVVEELTLRLKGEGKETADGGEVSDDALGFAVSAVASRGVLNLDFLEAAFDHARRLVREGRATIDQLARVLAGGAMVGAKSDELVGEVAGLAEESLDEIRGETLVALCSFFARFDPASMSKAGGMMGGETDEKGETDGEDEDGMLAFEKVTMFLGAARERLIEEAGKYEGEEGERTAGRSEEGRGIFGGGRLTVHEIVQIFFSLVEAGTVESSDTEVLQVIASVVRKALEDLNALDRQHLMGAARLLELGGLAEAHAEKMEEESEKEKEEEEEETAGKSDRVGQAAMEFMDLFNKMPRQVMSQDMQGYEEFMRARERQREVHAQAAVAALRHSGVLATVQKEHLRTEQEEQVKQNLERMIATEELKEESKLPPPSSILPLSHVSERKLKQIDLEDVVVVRGDTTLSFKEMAQRTDPKRRSDLADAPPFEYFPPGAGGENASKPPVRRKKEGKEKKDGGQGGGALHYLSRIAMKWFFFLGSFYVLLWALQCIELWGFVVRFSYLFFLYLAISPTMIARKKMSVKQIETRSFVTTLMTIVWGGMTLYSTRDAVEGIILTRHGVFSLWNKLLLVPMHYSDAYFWTLNVVDTVMWISSSPGGFPIQVCVGFGIVATSLAAVQRHLVTRTLMEVFTEVQRREKAEEAKERFLSYIMHEMRNPLSGAALLLVEFRGLLTDLAAAAASNAQSLHVSVKKETARMLILTTMLGGQFDKMRGVCDDVLQLEKLDKGGFSFVFSSQDVHEWMTEVAEKQRILMRGSGTDVQMYTQWKVEGEEVEKLLHARPLGVADFTRLEQVIDNFVGNARKFTKEGEISVEASLRFPSPSEQQHLEGLLLVSSDATENEEGAEEGEKSSRRKKRGNRRSNTKPQWRAAMRELMVLDESSSKHSEAYETPDQKSTRSAFTNRRERGPQSGPFGALQWVVFRLTVKDTGPGLSAEDISKLCLPYSQIRAGELQNGGGTGLGLCICSSFVKAHGGGQIGAQSEGRGKGSQFFFQIFLPLLAPNGEKQTPSNSFKGLLTPRVPLGVSPSSTRSHETPRRRQLSAAAYDKFATAVESKPRSPTSLDENEGGREEETHEGGAHGMGGEKNENKERGEAQPKLRLIAASPCASSPAGTGSASDSLSLNRTKYSADVLVVDDDRFCLMASEAAVRRMGYSVETATGGQEALDLIVNEDKRYRLILMDNSMGGMDGPCATKAIVKHFEQEHARIAKRTEQKSPQSVGNSSEEKVDASAAVYLFDSSEDPLKGGPGKQGTQPEMLEGPEEAYGDMLGPSEDPSQVLRVPFILGCTADTSEEVERLFVEAGGAGMMHKPVQIAKMSDWLTRLRNRS